MVTGKIRASYVHVFEPQAPLGGGEPKYSITMLIPKTDINTVNAIYAEIERAKQEGVSKVFQGRMPAVCKLPIYDGDGVRPNGEPFGEECHGHMVMTASSKTRPNVVDINVQPIMNAVEFYSGCYARVSLNFFAYNSNGNKGIGCGLNNVQKIEDGEPLSGRTTAEEDFGGHNAYIAAGTPMQGQQTHAMSMQVGYNPSAMTTQQGYNAFAAIPQQPSLTPQMQAAVNPITGLPITGGVMGI